MGFMNQKANEPICHILQGCHSESFFLTVTGMGKLLHVNRLTEMSKHECCIKGFYSFPTMFGWAYSFLRPLGEAWALESKQDVQVSKGMNRSMKKLENRTFSLVSSSCDGWKLLVR